MSEWLLLLRSSSGSACRNCNWRLTVKSTKSVHVWCERQTASIHLFHYLFNRNERKQIWEIECCTIKCRAHRSDGQFGTQRMRKIENDDATDKQPFITRRACVICTRRSYRCCVRSAHLYNNQIIRFRRPAIWCGCHLVAILSVDHFIKDTYSVRWQLRVFHLWPMEWNGWNDVP